jgi:hypothetical protein
MLRKLVRIERRGELGGDGAMACDGGHRGTMTTHQDSGWDELTTTQARQGEGYAARSTSRRQLARCMRVGRAGGLARRCVALARR